MSNRRRINPAGPLRIRAGLCVLAAALVVLSAGGCGGPAASVEGTVTLGGRPLPQARISFHPDFPGPVAYGLSLDDGSYRLKTGANQRGLAPGRYRVTVFSMDVVDGAEEQAGPLLTPAVYGNPAKTPLRCEVAAGPNQIPLTLESGTSAEKP